MHGGVIYAKWIIRYLTKSILTAVGAHARGFVQVVLDRGIFESVQANAVGNAGSAWQRGAVVWTLILDSGPTPRTSLAQLATGVVNPIEAAVTVARHGSGALWRGDGVGGACLQSKPACTERISWATGA